MCTPTKNQNLPLANPYAGASAAPASAAGSTTDENGIPIPQQDPGAALNAGKNMAGAGVPGSVPVNQPTPFGRILEVASMGNYDPTGGADSSTPPSGRPTKMAMLMNFIRPVITGGLVGLAGGKGTPGGGFNAANNHFQQQRQMQMQYAMMARQMQNDQFRNQLEFARTQHTLQQPNFSGRGVQPVAAKNAQGQTIFMARNPDTGVMEQVQGFTPPDPKAPADQNELSTDPAGNQVIVNKTKATARPVVMDGSGTAGQPQAGLPRVPGRSASEFDSGSPMLPGGPSASPTNGRTAGAGAAPSSGTLPLGPKAQTRASGWRTQAEEDAASEYQSKNPDASAADTLRYVSTLTREPKDNGLSPKEYRTRQAALITQLNTGFREIENQRERNVKSLGIFPDPNDLSQISSDTADAKQALHQRLVDSATAEGIDIGTVPDYRAQLQGGGAQGLPTTPSQAGPQSAPARPKGVPAAAVWNPGTKTWQMKRSSAGGAQ